MKLRIINILEEPTWKDRFLEKLEIYLLKYPHENNQSYENFNLELDKYICYHIILDGDNIICGSGLRSKEFFPNGFYRVCDRTFTFNREYSLFKRLDNNPQEHYGRIFVKEQIKFAKELNANGVFVSTEGKRKRYLNRWVKAVNFETGFDFKVLDNLRCTCKIENPKCWQKIALYNFSNKKFDLPEITYDKYNLMFKELK